MYIYIIQCADTPMYKVGVTSGLKRRLENLQTGCPFEIQYKYIVHCKSKAIAHSIEATLHTRLKPYHIRGEWFTLTNTWLNDTVHILQRVGKVVYNTLIEEEYPNTCTLTYTNMEYCNGI